MTNNPLRVTIYPNDIQVKFIRKEAEKNNRSISNYILDLIQEQIKNGK